MEVKEFKLELGKLLTLPWNVNEIMLIRLLLKYNKYRENVAGNQREMGGTG